MNSLPTVKVKQEPILLGPCLRECDGIITDIDQGMIHCFKCGEYYYELEETEEVDVDED